MKAAKRLSPGACGRRRCRHRRRRRRCCRRQRQRQNLLYDDFLKFRIFMFDAINNLWQVYLVRLD